MRQQGRPKPQNEPLCRRPYCNRWMKSYRKKGSSEEEIRLPANEDPVEVRRAFNNSHCCYLRTCWRAKKGVNFAARWLLWKKPILFTCSPINPYVPFTLICPLLSKVLKGQMALLVKPIIIPHKASKEEKFGVPSDSKVALEATVMQSLQRPESGLEQARITTAWSWFVTNPRVEYAKSAPYSSQTGLQKGEYRIRCRRIHYPDEVLAYAKQCK